MKISPKLPIGIIVIKDTAGWLDNNRELINLGIYEVISEKPLKIKVRDVIKGKSRVTEVWSQEALDEYNKENE